jgi:hypothetical protein
VAGRVDGGRVVFVVELMDDVVCSFEHLLDLFRGEFIAICGVIQGIV